MIKRKRADGTIHIVTEPNSGLQVTHAAFVNIYFMLLFDLTPDQGASEAIRPIPKAVI